MSRSDPDQVAAAGRLYEFWHVPVDLLATVIGVEAAEIEEWVTEQGWQRRDSSAAECSASDLYSRFIGVFADQLNQHFRHGGGEGGGERAAGKNNTIKNRADMEKQARALAGLAKALDIIVGVGQKLGNPNGKGHLSPHDSPLGTPSGSGGTEELDRQLTKLLENLVRQQPDPPVADPGDPGD